MSFSVDKRPCGCEVKFYFAKDSHGSSCRSLYVYREDILIKSLHGSEIGDDPDRIPCCEKRFCAYQVGLNRKLFPILDLDLKEAKPLVFSSVSYLEFVFDMRYSGIRKFDIDEIVIKEVKEEKV